MSRQGKAVVRNSNGVIGNSDVDGKRIRYSNSKFQAQNKIKNHVLLESQLELVQYNARRFDNSDQKNGGSSLLSTKETKIIRSKKQTTKNILNNDGRNLDSVYCYDQTLNKMLTGGVEDIKISMISGGNFSHFDAVEKEEDENETITKQDNQETQLYIAVPVSLADNAHTAQVDRQKEPNKSVTREQVKQDSGHSDCNSMHLAFKGGSGQELMLMTPQELERMPESGIEFEESVGPKETLSVSDLAAEREVIAGNGGEAETQTVATISISTDRDTDTTSIIINTKQGQQAYKINTADLMQAAATLQPITLADLVKEQVGEVVDISDTDNTHESNNTADVNKSILTPGCVQDGNHGNGIICTHTGRCKKAWTCAECGKVFNKQCKLKVHLVMHNGCRPFKCNVEGCDWTFTTVYKLNRHQESHCSAKEFRCDFEGCDRSFTTVYNLNSHKKIHAQPNIIICPIDSCNLQFHTRRKMELHLREHDGVEAPYKCSVESCGKSYYTANSLASHLRVHQKNHLQCTFEGCDKIFDRMSRFKTHMWKHTGERPYICTAEDCSWAFSSASKLKRHMRKHTGERLYKCQEPGCEKSFMRLEHLQGHTITHSGDKPFQCSHQNCGARFTANSSLYVHMKKHRLNEENVKYVCPVDTCGKRYNCKSSLRMHLLRYHSNESSDTNMNPGITLHAVDDNNSQTIVSDKFQQHSLVTVTVPHNEDGSSVLATDVLETNLTETQEFLLAPIIGGTPVADSNDLDTELIYPNDSNNLVLTAQRPASSNEIVLPSPPESSSSEISECCVLQTNNSGSARTDYCCNHLLTNRSRKRRRQQQKQEQIPNETACEEVVASNDVVLTSTAFQRPATDLINVLYLPNTLLPDDALPSHSELYQEDGLLSSMATELAVPISLFAEQPNGHSDFTGTTINLQDLE